MSIDVFGQCHFIMLRHACEHGGANEFGRDGDVHEGEGCREKKGVESWVEGLGLGSVELERGVEIEV
jgi:hypothetical protein